MVLGILSLVLTLIGLIYAVTAHPIILERIRFNRSSVYARVTALLLPSARSDAIPNEISLYEVIYHPAIKSDTYEELSGVKREIIVGMLGSAKNWRFIITPEFKALLKQNRLDYLEILVSLILEFHSHGYFVTHRGYLSNLEMAIRRGYFVNASINSVKEGRYHVEIVLNQICKIENEISDNRKWSICRDQYFLCRMLPYRYVVNANPADFLTKRDVIVVCQEILELESSINRYLASAVDISKTVRRKFAALSEKLTLTVGQMEKMQQDSQYSEFCVKAEMSLSYAHKIIFGDSAMSEYSVVTSYTYIRIQRIWSNQSLRMQSVSEQPVYSKHPDLR